MAYETIDRADAAAARTAAGQIGSAARQQRSTASVIGARVDGLEWTGPIRDRVVSALIIEAAVLDGLAGDADALAGRLEAHAAWIERETTRLDRLRAQVRRFAVSYPEHPFSVEFTATVEPPRWNTRWIELHRRSGNAMYIEHTPTSVVL